MNLKTINLVYQRELRDQMRDRRTLFTVLILPILIYPLLGLSMLHISQFSSAEPCRIWLIGADHLPSDSPLIAKSRFCEGLLAESERKITVVESAVLNDRSFNERIREYLASGSPDLPLPVPEWLKQEMIARNFDLAILVPAVVNSSSDDSAGATNIRIVKNSARGTSVTAAQRAQVAIQKWTRDIVVKNLGQLNIDVDEVRPYSVSVDDVADNATISAIKWSKTLPLIIVIWALTGAFYPAIDLCAGEKERGTLETLLSSPAPRSDIIGGKLLTVMTFSMLTAVLNMLSLGISAALLVGPSTHSSFLGQQLGITLPPFYVFPILLLALFPISGLFSALAFAIASFARSTKEGQYYLMPLMMLTFPLLIIPMLPGTHLNMGTCLIPVTGLILLLHSIIEGNIGTAATFFGPVCAVTLIGCGLALKWSAYQFNDESILFRAADHISFRALFKHWAKRRTETPTMTYAILCAVMILIAKFFSTFMASAHPNWGTFWRQTVMLLFIAVALPAIVLALATCRMPLKSLQLKMPQPWTLALAGLLAIFLHPIFAALTDLVMKLYPLSTSTVQAEGMMRDIFSGAPGMWATLMVLAVAPAICEELAFRGFVLSGLRSALGKFPAVLIASAFFGLAHSVLQQSIITFFIGIVLGLLAVRTESIVPCIVFHAVHNSLTMLFVKIDPGVVANSEWLQKIVLVRDGALIGYQPMAATLCGVAACVLALILCRHRVEETVWKWSRLPRAASAGG